jgi:hemin uptake protein HemP
MGMICVIVSVLLASRIHIPLCIGNRSRRTSMNERPEPCFDVEVADEPARQHDAATALPRVVASEVLLGGGTQLAILHKQTIYFLRETRLGKLILTK